MKRVLFAGLAAAVLGLSGCESQDRMKDEMAQLRQDNAELKARVTALEGKVEALTASLPDNDLPSDDQDSPTK